MSGPSTVLGRHGRVTPLGIRFWDEATQTAVSEGLVVTVFPPGHAERRATARPNGIGTFVLPHLPGPRVPEEEFGEGDEAFWSHVHPRPFIIEVVDRRSYYQPFTLGILLPARGRAVPGLIAPASPPAEVVPLFPTVGRPIPAGIAVVRADLQTPIGDAGRLGPAPWAMLEVQVGSTPPVRGIADRSGRVAVLLPYPEPTAGPARPSSPPYPGGISLHEQEWPLRLSVFFEPVTPTPQAPDLQRTLEQLPAMAWVQDAGGMQPLGHQVLRYGQELIVRSVVVTPAGSPP